MQISLNAPDELAAQLCSRNKYKGSDVASIDSRMGELTALYQPCRGRWSERFQPQDAT